MDGFNSELRQCRPALAADRNVIILVENRTIIRQCLEICLRSSYNHFKVVSFYNMAEVFKAALDSTKIAFMLYGIQHCPVSDPEIEQSLSQAKQAFASVPIILLSDEESAGEIVEALRQGARGFIPASSSLDIMVCATRIVCAGGTFVPATSLIDDMAASATGESPRADQFTRRQLDVLQCVRRGKTNKIIARELEMSESAVKTHVYNIMRKLKATNRTQLVILTRGLFAAENSAAELRRNAKRLQFRARHAQGSGERNGAVAGPDARAHLASAS